MTKEQAIERCHQLLETKHSNWLGLSNQQAIAILIDILKEKDTEIEKKDKQIDLMARAIDNYDSQLVINTFKDKEHVKQYFKRRAKLC